MAGVLGFDPLPAPFFLALLGMIVLYLVLVEVAKRWFFGLAAQRMTAEKEILRRRGRTHHVARRAARFSTPFPVR